MLIQNILFDQEASPDTAVACADRDLTFSYAELSRMSRDLAAGFLERGMLKGERIAILLANSIEFAAAFFGILTAGGVAVPVDIYLKKNDVLTILDTINPRILVTNPHLLRKIRSDLKGTTVCLVDFDGALSAADPDSGGTRMQGGSCRGERSLPSDPGFPRLDPAEDAVIILSSGTTGIPKAVRLSHRAVVQNIVMHLESLDLERDIRGLQVLPMNFSYGLIASFLSILYAGGTAVLLPSLEPRLVLETLARYDNLFMGTPAIFQYLIENSGPGPGPSAVPLSCVTIGGDRCKRYALNLIRSRFPSTKVYITYGLSEAGPRVSTLPHNLAAVLPHSIGLPLKGVEVAIVDDDGRRRAPYEAGEIVVKTPSLMSGYFGDAERTSRVLRDGRCHTGDIGYLDEGGFLYYVGRKDRQFKVAGRSVNPSFIEQCIATHPAVQEVSVGKKESERAESICARVKARGVSEQELLQDLKRLCRKHIPAYMIPGEFLVEAHDHYYYKGRVFNPVREQLPSGPVLERQ